jgi:peptidoglycan hydrolase-like protein with peptidoglycan-binding domain
LLAKAGGLIMPERRPDLHPGDTGRWVTYVQQTLNYYYRHSGREVVTVNGDFDAATAHVVEYFRNQHHLSAGQNVDSTLWIKLESGEPPDATGDVNTSRRSGRTWRSMTDYERSQAFEVFGSALAMDDVKLSEGGVMTLGGYSRTLPDHIYFETGVLQRDFSILIHELGHVWQYQKGSSVLGLACSAIDGDYDYGGEQGLRDALAHGKAFSDFGYEEQAQILQDYYRASDTSAFDPYVRSVRNGTHHQAPAAH